MQNKKLSPSQELTQKYMMNFIKRIPLTFVKGKGLRLWDENGKEYLDYVGGWAADSLGHCHPVVIKAATEQVRTLIHVSNAYHNLPQAQLAELLVKSSGFSKAFFSNSGAEAVEGAVKLARRYGALKLKGAYEVITAFKSFHGRTLAMTAATGQESFQKPYYPLPAGFINVEYNNIEAIKQVVNEKTCAVMVEPIQGEGGVNIPDDDYLKNLRAFCDEKNILLIFDEVQTGMGRLGKLYGYQVFDAKPDIITLAKGIASGIPIGAFLANAKADVFAPGEHGSTFGGNPFCCHIGCATVGYIIDKDIPGNADRMGRYCMGQLQGLQNKHESIAGVRGRGLLIALEFKRDIAEKVTYACLEKGLVINLLKPNLLRIVPPLIIKKADIDLGIRILDQVLTNLT
jgi:acetylornithine/N-succinyldiaminopimelate aminotransferase